MIPNTTDLAGEYIETVKPFTYAEVIHGRSTRRPRPTSGTFEGDITSTALRSSDVRSMSAISSRGVSEGGMASRVANVELRGLVRARSRCKLRTVIATNATIKNRSGRQGRRSLYKDATTPHKKKYGDHHWRRVNSVEHLMRTDLRVGPCGAAPGEVCGERGAKRCS